MEEEDAADNNSDELARDVDEADAPYRVQEGGRPGPEVDVPCLVRHAGLEANAPGWRRTRQTVNKQADARGWRRTCKAGGGRAGLEVEAPNRELAGGCAGLEANDVPGWRMTPRADALG